MTEIVVRLTASQARDYLRYLESGWGLLATPQPADQLRAGLAGEGEQIASRGKIEQDLENEQVRTLNRTGRCPVCGAEDDR